MSTVAKCGNCGRYAELPARQRCVRCYAHLIHNGVERPLDDPKVPTSVYLFYDADDRLLYVGISLSIAARMKSHQEDKPWWQDVVRAEFEHYDDEDAARERESHLVYERNPVHNVQLQRRKGMCHNPACRRPIRDHYRCAACRKYLQRNGKERPERLTRRSS